MFTAKTRGGRRAQRGSQGHPEKDTAPPSLTSPGKSKRHWHKLRKDKNRIIITADKGVSMVVMDREDYIRKAEELLN